MAQPGADHGKAFTIQDDAQEGGSRIRVHEAACASKSSQIVCALVDGERSVGELETRLSIRQPSLSQQLAELREAGIVEGRREVKQVFYRLADPRTAALIATLHRLFCGHVNQHAVLELSSSPRPERSRAIRLPRHRQRPRTRDPLRRLGSPA